MLSKILNKSLQRTCSRQFSTIPDILKQNNYLQKRHIGSEQTAEEMLKLLGCKNIDDLIHQTIPSHIYDNTALEYNGSKIPDEPKTEQETIQHLYELSEKNKSYKNFIGNGFYGTHTPPVILRNFFENPGWYTAYTPYQAEISQGRLESLLNYQTLVMDLTGLPVANASLLDESSAAAEVVNLAHGASGSKRTKFFISKDCFPSTISLVQTRARFLNVEVVVGDHKTYDFAANEEQLCGVLLQTPDNEGILHDFTQIFSSFKDPKKIIKAVASDLLALTISKAPGEMGADVVVGTSQRLGVPMGYGGPAAGFLAAKDDLKRKLPGRIIGVSKDAQGNPALRMALQTREQHIKREKATSNICTAQALLANMSAMYCIYHGPKGVRDIAKRVNGFAQVLHSLLKEIGYQVKGNGNQLFDTVAISVPGKASEIVALFEKHEINIRKQNEDLISVSFDETHNLEDVQRLVEIFSAYIKVNTSAKHIADLHLEQRIADLDGNVKRTKLDYMTQQVFNHYHSETEMMRYMHRLQTKDISLVHSMIPLGSCTMKLNAASQLIPVSFRGFSKIHPFTPLNQVEGYTQMLNNLKEWLKAVTKFDDVSLQPNSGATGEYAGLLVIRQYLESIGQGHRNVCLIPTSAHGTNPASAIVAGLNFQPVGVVNGFVDLKSLKEQAEKYKDNLACLMITYPSTSGIYEETIKEMIDVIHHYGGQVYMDGANMNAQSGFTSPGFLGADVCHLNLHKTFAIPHGGGGPGMGPIGVKKHLAPFLPNNPNINVSQSNTAISSAPFGSASILPISYSYFMQLAKEGVKKSTAFAILNANYLRKRVQGHYQILYENEIKYCAHEFIIDCRPFKEYDIKEVDIAKRLMDFGFHAPTISFPVAGTMMVEPTESESKEELDRFAEALIKIRQEIQMVIDGKYSKTDNPIKNAPHTHSVLLKSEWNHPYTREEAAYPLPWVKSQGKYWPPVSRIDDPYGDRNFICSLNGFC
ncbi:glycine dehydrogenase [decarboxylating] protein (macronuclear) [Tetrahymena thermophila SB210]|uniref:Glycine cleavage system P protein n=1 Tax=Tetrahymena thermophila (strain SB210) TaxID=312017 RepID=Q23W29_TETTS|nr:glycine dehydrogenase [decarboxylating] protein [Tetrahymena thermophila SB210]EAS00676.1 glycine dehydrogenase [decarboxylating] protein [Tetrahymena thermophila SB210]|eukprot:XP_001020921.1 glycine dehydrogenase [decarboxylating] protein [Tetrahymena thermophila SB210]